MIKDYLIIIAIWFLILVFIAAARGPSTRSGDYPIDAGCHAGYNC